jgi:hypothetical protein
MANMSYCRFQNTLHDFQDCYDALEEVDFNLDAMENNEEEGDGEQWSEAFVSPRERSAAIQLIKMAKELVEDMGQYLE